MRRRNVSVLPLWTRRNLPHLRAGSHRINRRHHKISEFRRAIWLILVLLIRLLRLRRLSGIIVAGMLPRLKRKHRSEERRVGKEGRTRWGPDSEKKERQMRDRRMR